MPTVINIFLGVTNIVLFVVWASTVKVEMGAGTVMDTAQLDSLGFGLAIVEALVAVIALGLVALAIVGYSEIRSASERRAEEAANKEVTKAVAELRKDIQSQLALQLKQNIEVGSTEETSTEEESDEVLGQEDTTNGNVQ